jgi:signal transduction histidine kinase
MKKQIWLATLGYLGSVWILLSFLYWFLKNEGFDEIHFIIGSILILLLSIGWGYIIASHLILPRKKTREHLLHLTKDIIHELNLPLSTIQANTDMLSRRLEDERSQKRLKRIEDASGRLKRLYDELSYAIRKEVHQVEREHVHLDVLVKERIEIFREQHRNRIVTELFPCCIITDRIGFEQVFDNLLNNAMKYSPREKPVKVMLQGNVLRIIDEGIGMDEAQIVRVYERYYQGNRQKEGEGIGLALVKAYCDREDIAIQIESKQGVGTEVALDLNKIVCMQGNSFPYKREKGQP